MVITDYELRMNLGAGVRAGVRAGARVERERETETANQRETINRKR